MTKYSPAELQTKIDANYYAEKPEDFIQDCKDTYDVTENEYSELAMGQSFNENNVSTIYNYNNILVSFIEKVDIMVKSIASIVNISSVDDMIEFPTGTQLFETGNKIVFENSVVFEPNCTFFIRNNGGQKYLVYATKQDAIDNTNNLTLSTEINITVKVEVQGE